jgi:hypothetical protein
MASPHKAAAEGMAAGLPESPTAAVIYDLDIGTAAPLMLKRYGNDALLEAAERADQMARRGRHGRRQDVAPHPERDRAAAGEGTGGGGEGALGTGTAT